MAKGDSGRAQQSVNNAQQGTQQGAINTQHLSNLQNQYDYLAYGGSPLQQQGMGAPSNQPRTTTTNPFGQYADVPSTGRTLGQAIGSSANKFVNDLNQNPATSPFATTSNKPTKTADGTAPASSGGGYSGSGMPARPATIEEAVAMANQIAYGGRNQNNAAYWAEMWAKDPEYTWRRMLGEFGGGADVATGGPFAGRDYGPHTGGGYLQGLQNAMGGYNEFSETGGFSGQDIQNIRARSNAPIRAMYQTGMDEMERMRNVQGGFMPNFAPGMAKMNREMSYRIGDQSLNTEAMIADAIRSGRLAGLGGMSNLGTTLSGQNLQLAGLTNQAQANQNQYNLGLTAAQIAASQVPSDFNQGMANVGQVAGMASPIIDALINYGKQPNTGAGSAGQTSGVYNPSGIGMPTFGGEGYNPANSGIPGVSNFGNPFSGGPMPPVFSNNQYPTQYGQPIGYTANGVPIYKSPNA